MDIMQHPNLMKYKNYRYFKTAGWLVAITTVAYVTIQPADAEAHGGTWLGYLLGVISTLIILLLMWYGIRKRRTPMIPDRRQHHKGERRKQGGTIQTEFFAPRKIERRKCSAQESWRYGGTLQGWLSAHVYLGTSLIILASFHSGLQFGWNVHTLVYFLMLLVVASGIYGVLAYLHYPRLITNNIGQDSLGDVQLKIAELDELARICALGLPDEVNTLVLKARQETRVGGNFVQQLKGHQQGCPTDIAVKQIRLLSEVYVHDDQPKLLRDLYSVLLQKQKLVLRARNEIMLKARMQFWAYLHAPLSIALLAALFVHIVAIFFYW